MAGTQLQLLALLGLIVSVYANTCPSCYTATVAGFISCPIIPVPNEPCWAPDCIQYITKHLPGKNPACAATPTVTTYGACPTKVTCHRGCSTVTRTVTDAAISCDVPVSSAYSGGVSWDTAAATATGGVSWDPEPSPTDESSTAIPVLPETSPPNQISINPPSYSVSWDLGPTGEPATPSIPDESTTDAPSPPDSTPSNQISLNSPSYWVSWDLGPTPAPTTSGDSSDATTDAPEPAGATPSNQASLNSPSYYVSWGKRQDDDDPTTIPGLDLPTPSNDIGLQPPQPSISWGKRQDEGDPTDVSDIPGLSLPTPSDTIGLQPPEPYISWGKRDPAPQTNSWGLAWPTFSFYWPQPPKHTSAYVSWGKEKRDVAVKTKSKKSTKAPAKTTAQTTTSSTTSPDSVGLQFPTQTFSWGKPSPTKSAYVSWGKEKREEAAAQTDPNSVGLQWPTNYLSWDIPWPHRSYSSAYVSWGKEKREAQVVTVSGSVIGAQPTDSEGLGFPTATGSLDSVAPSSTAYVSWGRRDAAPEPTVAAMLNGRDTTGERCSSTTTITRPVPCPLGPLICPEVICPVPLVYDDAVQNSPDGAVAEPSDCPVTVTVASKCPTCPRCPSLTIPISGPKTITSSCPTVTKTIVPPCIPPSCPELGTPCVPAPTWKTAVKREVEKRVVTTVVLTPTPVPVGTSSVSTGCEGAKTVTVNAGCPTWTCVPGCHPASVVR